ncbi:MAG TPA: Lrp/AsnC ligand binding domain-containing protein [archaeon]|nr:Lrp/AsnC ligand binding domain-containing protein [archaeon]
MAANNRAYIVASLKDQTNPDSILKAIRAKDYVREAHIVTGAYDVHIEVEYENNSALKRYRDELMKDKDIRLASTLTLVILS